MGNKCVPVKSTVEVEEKKNINYKTIRKIYIHCNALSDADVKKYTNKCLALDLDFDLDIINDVPVTGRSAPPNHHC